MTRYMYALWTRKVSGAALEEVLDLKTPDEFAMISHLVLSHETVFYLLKDLVVGSDQDEEVYVQG